MKRLSALSLLCVGLHAAVLTQDVVPQDKAYYTTEVRNTRLIYTEANLPFAQEAADVERELQPLYEQMYGYRMDETLNVGLISSYNQIANGFSTPYPNNRQINYDGGALKVDYFCSPSWLKTLLYHETAHNYQDNVKDNVISSSLHSVIGNGAFFIPWFTIPNITESSFMLEGNAVLNESWHGNGGRLYSGRFKAATLMQARAGYLTRARVYNDNYYFLYGSHFYTLGGFYNYYLAEHYGLKRTNDYWKMHSRDWFWPFFTNRSMQDAVGADFDTTFAAWSASMKAEASQMKDVPGDAVASTQFYYPMNGDADEIYFITNPTGRSFPELVVYDKATGKITKTSGSYLGGKVVRLADGRYVTQGSAHTSPWRIYAGLYDENAMPVEGTRSKVVEGYLHDGRTVYFDVPKSFDRPQLYVGNTFYAQVNSSVYIDKDDNLYYFVQGADKQRTLYRNKTPLYTFKGYYGNVSGVDSRGAVYFIANTPHGSGLFRFFEGNVTRADPADTIIEARLIDDHHALAAVMGSDAYLFKKITLGAAAQTPYEVKLFVEDKPYYHAKAPEASAKKHSDVGLDDPYYSFLAMNYSGTDIFLGAESGSGLLFNVSVNFADPLLQNSLSLFALRNADQYTLAGARYSNDQYFLTFSLTAYGVVDTPDLNATQKADERNYGVALQTALPFVKRGYYNASLLANYYQDYESNSREPLSLALPLSRSEQFGVSMYRNFLLNAEPYVSFDRGDTTVGGKGALQYGLPYEFYAGISGQYSQSDAETYGDSRGVKITQNELTMLVDGDPTNIVMPSVKNTAYVKRASKASLQLKKVFNLADYFFTFPVSLRREALTLDYNRYKLDPFGGIATQYANEIGVGIVFDTYWLNRMPIPITVSYYHNDNTVVAQQQTLMFSFGLTF